MSRPYRGESRDEWEHVTCPEDLAEPEAEDSGDREDAAYERMVQMELDGEL